MPVCYSGKIAALQWETIKWGVANLSVTYRAMPCLVVREGVTCNVSPFGGSESLTLQQWLALGTKNGQLNKLLQTLVWHVAGGRGVRK